MTKKDALLKRVSNLNTTQARIALRKLIQEEMISLEYAKELLDVAESYS